MPEIRKKYIRHGLLPLYTEKKRSATLASGGNP